MSAYAARVSYGGGHVINYATLEAARAAIRRVIARKSSGYIWVRFPGTDDLLYWDAELHWLNVPAGKSWSQGTPVREAS